jgi:hypothetical protein
MYNINPSNVMVDSREINKVYRSLFDLSHEVKGDGDMGLLYPILYEDVIPGDIFKMRNNFVIKFNPLVGMLFHQIFVKIYYFFVPYRLVWSEWEEFITRGKTGNVIKNIPLWTPTNQTIQKGKLWDALGLPLVLITNDNAKPHALVKRAYNLIWNEWFSDPDLQDPVDIDVNENLLYKNWDKDYFTASRPSLQRGISPAIPLIGSLPLNFLVMDQVYPINNDPYPNVPGTAPAFFGYTKHIVNNNVIRYKSGLYNVGIGAFNTDSQQVNNALNHFFSVNTSNVTAGNVKDLRTVIQLQVWLERNMRSGYRYVDFLKAHFNVSPNDDRLQRPEFLGGFKDIIVSNEIYDTAGNENSPLGRQVTNAHSIYFANEDVVYKVQEHGLIMALMVVYPRSQYIQGVPRYFLKRTTFDFYFPEFALIGDQEIFNAELFVTNTSNDRMPFSYTGRYDEYRYRESRIIGNLRDTFSYTHLARIFQNPPVLNGNFLKCIPRKDFLAVPSEPTFFFSVGNIITAWRPIPYHSNPMGIFRLSEEDFGIGGSNKSMTNLKESLDNT